MRFGQAAGALSLLLALSLSCARQQDERAGGVATYRPGASRAAVPPSPSPRVSPRQNQVARLQLSLQQLHGDADELAERAAALDDAIRAETARIQSLSAESEGILNAATESNRIAESRTSEELALLRQEQAELSQRIHSLEAESRARNRDQDFNPRPLEGSDLALEQQAAERAAGTRLQALQQEAQARRRAQEDLIRSSAEARASRLAAAEQERRRLLSEIAEAQLEVSRLTGEKASLSRERAGVAKRAQELQSELVKVPQT